MRYSAIRDLDISNGVGVACSLFVQGCHRHCFNCFNSNTWDFEGGKEWTKDIEDKFIDICKKSYIDCISILGGEPLDQDLSLLNLLQRIKHEVNKPIFLWTGYTIDIASLENKNLAELCKCCTYIIDGAYIDSLRDYKLHLRGSSNQRIIDIQKTLQNGKIILATELY
jgi:anaerobic ribonucleoside-triphosphate reductase activating protein